MVLFWRLGAGGKGRRMNKYELLWVYMYTSAKKAERKYLDTKLDDPNYEKVGNEYGAARIILDRMKEVEEEVKSWRK